MEEWKIRLRQAREAKGLNKTAFARLVEVSNPTVTDWEKAVEDGGIQEIAGHRLAKICSVLGVTPGWILDGQEPMEYPGAMRVVVAEHDDPDFVQIPMVKLRLSAGVTGYQTETDRREGGTLGMRRNWLDRTGLNPANLIAIQVKGDSMEPSLYEDDVVVLNTADRRPVDGAVFAVNYEGEAVVKRFARDAGDWWLTSDSPDQRKHHRKVCRGDACIIIGRVVRKESDRI
jgi:phage repressor protein C with HTH and peptisase S24 domain